MSRASALKAWETIRKTKTPEQIQGIYQKAAATRAVNRGITPALAKAAPSKKGAKKAQHNPPFVQSKETFGPRTHEVHIYLHINTHGEVEVVQP